MWFFLVLGFTLEEKLHEAKCCKYSGPEGVTFIFSKHTILHFQRIALQFIQKTYICRGDDSESSSMDESVICHWTLDHERNTYSSSNAS